MSLDLIQIRRALHRIPEPAYREKSTKALLLEILGQWPALKIHEFKNSNGLLAEYSCGEGDYRLFRADMDALPVTENTGCDFVSTRPGFMHACGHDVHMTVLLGLIEAVCERRIQRNLLFLFQPAEEGQGGAEAVLAEKLIQSFPVRQAFALHVASALPVATVSSRAGIFFGIPQEFDVTFTGRSAHAAFPEQGVNALAAARQFLNLMDSCIARLAQTERVIFHVGKLQAGTVRNVVPDHCVLEGTQRTLSQAVRDQVNRLILENCAKVARNTGTQYSVEFLGTYDPVVNDPALVLELQEVCRGLKLDYREAEIALTGEDFGFFTTLYPGLLFWLGSGCEAPLHSDRFLPDDACIGVGVRIFTQLALN